MTMSLALLVAISGLTQSSQKKDWIWWTPPSSVDTNDRLGKTSQAILRMGRERWSDYAYRQVEEEWARKWPGSRANGVDGAIIVYGVCLAERNDRLLSAATYRKRKEFRRLRSSLYRFGMACIALEDVFAGGGTYSIHEPKNMFVRAEETLHDLLVRPKTFLGKETLTAQLQARVDIYKDHPGIPAMNVGRIPTKAQVQLWARRIDRSMDECLSAADAIDGTLRPRTETFLRIYLFDYVSIRGFGLSPSPIGHHERGRGRV